MRRRTFLKVLGAVGGGWALGAGAPMPRLLLAPPVQPVLTAAPARIILPAAPVIPAQPRDPIGRLGGFIPERWSSDLLGAVEAHLLLARRIERTWQHEIAGRVVSN